MVPGISGGTMALIIGIYEELIESIRHLTRRSSWEFLIPLLLGIATAFFTLSTLFYTILNDPELRIFLYSVFLGLVAASVILLGKKKERWHGYDALIFMAGLSVGWFLTGHSWVSKSEETRYQIAIDLPQAREKSVINYKEGILFNLTHDELSIMVDKGYLSESHPIVNMATGQQELIENKTYPSRFNLKVFASGMMAVCAMLLPGISGSYLLNIIGMYAPAIAAVSDLSVALKSGTMDYDSLWFLISMGAGVAVGAALFSHFIAWLLENHHGTAVALLTGVMVGSLRSVWPFWATAWNVNPLRLKQGLELAPQYPTLPSFLSGDFAVAIIAALMAFSLVFVIEYLAKKRKTVSGS